MIILSDHFLLSIHIHIEFNQSFRGCSNEEKAWGFYDTPSYVLTCILLLILLHIIFDKDICFKSIFTCWCNIKVRALNLLSNPNKHLQRFKKKRARHKRCLEVCDGQRDPWRWLEAYHWLHRLTIYSNFLDSYLPWNKFSCKCYN